MKRRPMVDMDEFERRLRRQSSGNQTDDDPLAEARLTSGQQDLEDCRSAGPEFDRSAAGEASSSEAQETVAQEPDPRSQMLFKAQTTTTWLAKTPALSMRKSRRGVRSIS